MQDPKRRDGAASARGRGTLGWAALLLVVLPGDERPSSNEERPSVARVWIQHPGTYWKEAGFFELTPPIRLPSRDGLEKITIWLRIPEGQTLRVRRRGDGTAELSYPPGTVADRVDLRDGQDDASVEDVRGIRFETEDEYFRVLRAQDDASDLFGFEWPRGSVRSARMATDQLLDLVGQSSSLAEAHDPEAVLRLLARQNDCTQCHLQEKPERRGRIADLGEPLPNRKTDGGGLYTVETVLSDSAPIETHRARDMNEGEPYVSIACSDGNRAILTIGPRGIHRHYACADRSVPYATFALREALAHGDPHALAVCESRAYLEKHMTAEGRAVYATPLGECSPSNRWTKN
jgi:hypothetical protein